MNYPVKIYQIETTNGFEWMAEFPDVDGVVGGGATKTEALAEAEENLRFHLDYLKENGISFPKVTDFDNPYSGKLQFRTSKTIHKKLTEASVQEGISINSYINEAVTSKLAHSEALSLFKKATLLVGNFYSYFNKEKDTVTPKVQGFSKVEGQGYGGYYGIN